jgi:PTH1 family peptidyl-tRNA hydrolase
MNIIVGLGNPGEEYKATRHNAGRMIAEYFVSHIEKIAEHIDGKKAVKDTELSDFEFSKKYNALASKGTVFGESVLVLLPETFMNKSGASLKDISWSAKKAEKLIVVHDDLDLPVGRMKLMFNRGSGGHKGVESIQRAIKTEAYTRLKIGICPTTPSGKPKKPDLHSNPDFVISAFRPNELDEIKKLLKKASEALYVAVTAGRERAMNEFNG